jgi:hypothetical protein
LLLFDEPCQRRIREAAFAGPAWTTEHRPAALDSPLTA